MGVGPESKSVDRIAKRRGSAGPDGKLVATIEEVIRSISGTPMKNPDP